MNQYEIFYEDNEKTGIRQFDEEYQMWIECYIPKNKDDYTELNELMKQMFYNKLKLSQTCH